MQYIPNSKFQIPNSKRGQSLLEILIAIALAGILLGSATALIVAFLQVNKKNQESQTAIDLGNALMDGVRTLANQSWRNIYDLDHTVSSGLVGHWKFDETSGTTATDSTGNGNDGTLIGPNRVSGKIGNALNFDGINDWVSIADNSILDAQENMTVSVWVKLDQLGHQKILFKRFFGISGDAPWLSWELLINSSNQFVFQVPNYYNGAWEWSSSGYYGVMEIGRWYQVVGVKSGGYLKMYVDASTEYTWDWSFSGTLQDGDKELGIGAAGGGIDFLNGKIDDVRIYNRALSEAEIQSLWLGHEISPPNYVTSTPSFAAIEGEETIEVNGITYTRWFYVENVYRDGSGSIVSKDSSGAKEDPSTQFVVVRVTWDRNPGGLNFSEFLTRSKNEIFRQTDWSGGPGQTGVFPGEYPNHKFDSANNIDGTSTQGELKVIFNASQGELTSSVFDTKSMGGVALNSIMWKGIPESDSVVKFQIASSNCTNGKTNPPQCDNADTWNYIGDGGTSLDWYVPTGPDIPFSIPIGQHNNVRYFRYKIQIIVNSGGTSPEVKDVIINYSP